MPRPATTFGPDELVDLVEVWPRRGAAALGVKAGRYLDELPPQMLAAADRLGFPLVRLPARVAFDDVMSEVIAQLVDRQTSALDLADRLHRALSTIVLEGGDLPQLADEFAALFECRRAHLHGGRTGADRRRSDDAVAALRALPLFDPSGRFMTERT